ncbi:MAG: response regulator transcription factor [Desulfofustis sp.]|jgi:two-component system, NarL family, nitrate/nitrite response regulator NarL
MKILLCSKNESVLKRWRGGLQDEHQIFEADSLEAAYRIIGKNDIGLTMLHRVMINEQQIRDVISLKRGSKVFILSDRPSNDEGISCLQIGCVGYANSYIAQPRLKLAVQAVQSGLIWTGTSLMQHMIQTSTAGLERTKSAENPGKSGVLDTLSKREYQVAALVAEGLPNREVAERLDITERTVKAHLSSAYAKTAMKSRLGLARLFAAG